ncbi:MAG TPA: DUF58 domain-containing protein [Gaiellaceae bacterium]
MTRTAAPKLRAYTALAAIGLLAALALRRAELVVLAAPFALLLGLGLAAARTPDVRVELALDRERVLEGDEVLATLELQLQSSVGVERLDVVLPLPQGLEATSGKNPIGVRVPAGEPRRVALGLRCVRWGGYVVGDCVVRARDPAGLFVYEARALAAAPLRVYPRPAELRTLLDPLETQVFAGNQVARARGDGIEFADLRQFVPGDRLRRVNWRASARRGELWVNDRHPERNADVILFLDTFVEARRGDGEGTLTLAVRAAAALARRYLERRDRVGLVGFGGVLTWLLPETGLVHLYRVTETLIGTEVTVNYAWKDVEVIPRRTLPPKALVLALSPLLDDRAVAALVDLRARGFDLAVIEISPVPFTGPGRDPSDALAHRLWLLDREALRARYRRAGIAVVEWQEDAPFASALEEVAAYRRSARRVRV